MTYVVFWLFDKKLGRISGWHHNESPD